MTILEEAKQDIIEWNRRNKRPTFQERINKLNSDIAKRIAELLYKKAVEKYGDLVVNHDRETRDILGKFINPKTLLYPYGN